MWWRIIATASPPSPRRSKGRCRKNFATRGLYAGRSLARRACPTSLPAASPIFARLRAAPDIVLVADRTGKPVGEVAATYFAAGTFFRLDRIAGAASNYSHRRLFRPAGARSRAGFDRRCRAPAHRRDGRQWRQPAPAAVEAWVAPRKNEVERIRVAIHEIANSGLDAVEALRRGEPAWRFGEELSLYSKRDRRTGSAHKKEPQAITRLGSLSCCLNSGLSDRATGCRGDGEPPGLPSCQTR